MKVYLFREGAFDSVQKSMRPIGVQESDGSPVGEISRGEIAGCEASGTFQFTPRIGQPTRMGVRRGTLRTAVSRLLQPRYDILHDGQHGHLVERFGENLLYFAVRGKLSGRQVDAREDWNGSVKVTTQGEEIGRFHPGGLLTDTRVEITRDDPGSAEFGLMILLPLIHRIYKDESDAIASLFE